MLNINELWIGDQILIIKSGKKGVFKGVHYSGKARIQVGDKVILVSARNIKLIEETNEITNLELPDEKITHNRMRRKAEFINKIDLHIDVLNPSLENEIPQIILHYQIARCQSFIELAIELGERVITIIHGKGTGQLRREVAHLITLYDKIHYSIPTQDGGATEVWLR